MKSFRDFIVMESSTLPSDIINNMGAKIKNFFKERHIDLSKLHAVKVKDTNDSLYKTAIFRFYILKEPFGRTNEKIVIAWDSNRDISDVNWKAKSWDRPRYRIWNPNERAWLDEKDNVLSYNYLDSNYGVEEIYVVPQDEKLISVRDKQAERAESRYGMDFKKNEILSDKIEENKARMFSKVLTDIITKNGFKISRTHTLAYDKSLVKIIFEDNDDFTQTTIKVDKNGQISYSVEPSINYDRIFTSIDGYHDYTTIELITQIKKAIDILAKKSKELEDMMAIVGDIDRMMSQIKKNSEIIRLTKELF